ncbi:metabotropic glutamate receptor 2-like [Penaeus vannamei]|uniref:metabotropic glutamate receptor 2-like n=1 Tax=Penaeus vannamei TaxID=6689 RepID=UPI00387F91E6
MLFSSVGLVMTGVVMWVFVSHNDTPVVRASGRELSYVLLSGVFLCYAMTFVFVLKPSAVVCGIQRFGLGFCFAVVYSALLTKTNRIARIFNAGKRTAKRPSFITPKSQLCICFFIVSIQVFV